MSQYLDADSIFGLGRRRLGVRRRLGGSWLGDRWNDVKSKFHESVARGSAYRRRVAGLGRRRRLGGSWLGDRWNDVKSGVSKAAHWAWDHRDDILRAGKTLAQLAAGRRRRLGGARVAPALFGARRRRRVRRLGGARLAPGQALLAASYHRPLTLAPASLLYGARRRRRVGVRRRLGGRMVATPSLFGARRRRRVHRRVGSRLGGARIPVPGWSGRPKMIRNLLGRRPVAGGRVRRTLLLG